MRVQGGSAKGRKLGGNIGANVRPTTARVKKSIFDSLFNVVDFQGARVLDLFAGTGALGFECASRGASSVVFVESNIATSKSLSKTLGLLSKDDIECDFKVVQFDAVTYLKRNATAQFDLAFVDPPYVFDEWSEILDTLNAKIIVAESNRELPQAIRYERIKFKKYGDTYVSFLKRTF
ncbi:MAG: RsmD family RNA methyltransferase [Actinomycetota bacterium]|nr:RsmD family RNA methyltransferase [Actinomycetota bacterium]